MPLEATGKRLQREMIRYFTGVVLSLEDTSLGEGGLSVGCNIDLHERPGTILTRRGYTQVHSSLGDGNPLRLVYLNSSGVSFASGGTQIFVRGTGEDTENGISDISQISIIEYRGVNAPLPEVFVANGGMPHSSSPGFIFQRRMYRWTRRQFDIWGIDGTPYAPLASVGGGTGLTGDYSVKFTYIRKFGGSVVSESNPSGASNTVTLANEDLDFTVVASDDSSVTNIRVYRTVAGGATYLFDQDVDNTTATVTSSQSDGGLGSAVDEDNDVPRPATLAHVLRDRVWLNDIGYPSRLHWSKRFFPESFPANNFIDVTTNEDAITALASSNNVLVAFTARTKYRVIEQDDNTVAVTGDIPFIGASTAGFVSFELPSARGTSASRAVVSTPVGIIYPSRDGIYVTDGTTAPEQSISDEIQPIFDGVKVGDIPPINTALEKNMVAVWYRRKYFLSYTSVESASDSNDYTVIISPGRGIWFWDMGFSSFFVDAEKDRLLAGRPDGSGVQLEAPGIHSDEGSAISATVETAAMPGGDAFLQSNFFYMRVDAEVHADDTLEATFYADDTAVVTKAITGNRTRRLLRLPASSRGHTWKVGLSYSGTHQAKIHGVETQFKTLAIS